MEYIQNVTFDLNTLQAPVIIGAKQYDTDTRGIRVTYTKNGEPYQIHENNIVRLRMRKPDNTSILNDAQNNGDGTVTVIFSQECLSAAGRAYADLMEFSQGKILSTFSFVVDIQPAPNISVSDAFSSSEFQSLLNFINQGQNIIGKAQEWVNGYNGDTPIDSSSEIDEPGSNNNAKYWSEQAYEAGEAWAEGTRGGVDVDNDDPTYNHNAKYWSKRSEAWANGTINGEPISSGDDAFGINSKAWGEAWAVGTRNGIDLPSSTEEDIPGADNNSKYWAFRTKACIDTIQMSYDSATGMLSMIIEDL